MTAEDPTPGVRSGGEGPQTPAQRPWEVFYRESRKRRRAWKGCEACPTERRDPKEITEVHHVLSQRRLKRYAVDQRLSVEERLELLTDPSNSMILCRACHHRHTVAFDPIRYSAIPEEAVAFARDLGLDHELREEYR